MKLTGLPPRAVWAMRTDEAIAMLAARKRINQAGSNAQQTASRERPDVETVDLPGGRREVRIKSLAGLRTILQRAPEQSQI